VVIVDRLVAAMENHEFRRDNHMSPGSRKKTVSLPLDITETMVLVTTFVRSASFNVPGFLSEYHQYIQRSGSV
jgi:hypothetical protein